jgi:hypothetical protein
MFRWQKKKKESTYNVDKSLSDVPYSGSDYTISITGMMHIELGEGIFKYNFCV